MRILYLINSVEGGGAALPVPSIAGALARHGGEVRVFALARRDGRALAAFEGAGVPVTVRDGGERDHAAAFRWLKEILRREKPDALWTSLTRATLLGQRAARPYRTPVVSWQHAAFLKPANAFLLRRQQHLSALWIGDSAHVTELTASRLGVGHDRLLTWPIFAADPLAPSAVPLKSGDRLRLGSLGRLHPVKGYDLLVEAVGLLHRQGFRAPVNWEVTIAGDGAERERLSRLIGNLPADNLHLLDYTADPRSFLAGLHAYVQPSRSEGFCVAAHEAMQAGLPVLASAVGELSNSIEHGRCGWLVPPRNADDLAVGLAGLLSEPDRLAVMGQAARTRVVERFGEERFITTAGTILERLAGIVQARRSASGPGNAPGA